MENCELEEITAAELLASKILSLIEKTTGDNDLKKKIKLRTEWKMKHIYSDSEITSAEEDD